MWCLMKYVLCFSFLLNHCGWVKQLRMSEHFYYTLKMFCHPKHAQARFLHSVWQCTRMQNWSINHQITFKSQFVSWNPVYNQTCICLFINQIYISSIHLSIHPCMHLFKDDESVRKLFHIHCHGHVPSSLYLPLPSLCGIGEASSAGPQDLSGDIMLQ